MKAWSRSLVAFGLCALVVAQNGSEGALDTAGSLPSCAVACVLTEVPKSNCSIADTQCVCRNTQLNSAIVACIERSCSVKDALRSAKFQARSCGAPVRDQTGNLKLASWLFFGLGSVAYVLRITSRLPIMGGKLGWDDLVITLVWLCLIPDTSFGTLLVGYGLGRDIWEVPFDHITRLLFWFYIDEMLYTFCVIFAKVSLLCFYLRIFPDQNFRNLVIAVKTICILYVILSIFMLAFQCRPVSYSWNKWDGEHTGKCFNIPVYINVTAGINIALDLIVFFIPIPQVARLNQSKRRRIGVASMFLVGLFVTVCSVIRLVVQVEMGDPKNFTMELSKVALWSVIEVNVSVICACMPGIATLIRRIWSLTHKSSQNRTPPPARNSPKPNEAIELQHPLRRHKNPLSISIVVTDRSMEGSRREPAVEITELVENDPVRGGYFYVHPREGDEEEQRGR